MPALLGLRYTPCTAPQTRPMSHSSARHDDAPLMHKSADDPGCCDESTIPLRGRRDGSTLMC
jgi:hypothetical protein